MLALKENMMKLENKKNKKTKRQKRNVPTGTEERNTIRNK